jgi:hypothetical protein
VGRIGAAFSGDHEKGLVLSPPLRAPLVGVRQAWGGIAGSLYRPPPPGERLLIVCRGGGLKLG